jgi:hypothetical protein
VALAFGMRIHEKQGVVISEHDMVEAALTFANGKDWETQTGSPPSSKDSFVELDELDESVVRAMEELRRVLPKTGSQNGADRLAQELDRTRKAGGAHRRERERSRKWLREALSQIYTDPAAAITKLRQPITAAASRIGAYVHVEFSATGLSAKPVISPGRDAAIYLVALLLDSSRPYGRDLCQCKLEGCGNYFLVYRPPTGRPRRDYCSPQHMEEAQHRTLSARVMKSRRKATAARRPK